MKIAIVGYGVENQSVYRYFQRMGGQEVTICDQNENAEVPVESSSRLGPSYLEDLDSFDVIVRTPGMNRQTILDKNPNVSSKITTAVNIFFENNITPTIGVTGTKGKGTTSTLISKILEASGKKVVLCGNIGTPMLDKLEEAAVSDYVVMELSSFQLSDVRHSPETAVCLMVVPEHLNWHSDLNDYISAKQNIFKFQLRDNVTIHAPLQFPCILSR
jgi:UDP-N-acetylmuramoylalanine--D-glutamate ligase